MGLLPSTNDLEAAGEKLATNLVSELGPAIEQAIIKALDGLHVEVKVTLDVTKKPS